MLQRASLALFQRAYPGIRPTALARAPGRVNLIGEHIDYCGGPVLPIAINRETRVVVGRTEDGVVRARSAAEAGEAVIPVDVSPDRPMAGWAAYIQGIVCVLGERGVRLPGAVLTIDSDLPIGAGLSSSAALEVGVMLALLATAESPDGGAERKATTGGMGDQAALDRKEIAALCREAERRFAGVPCGLMDQTVVALAEAGAALWIDCADGVTRSIACPNQGARVLVVDSGLRRRLAEGAYEQRFSECAQAFAVIQSEHRQVCAWREVTADHLACVGRTLGERHHRRARHIVTEFRRVQAGAAAWATGEVGEFGRLMKKSHLSLRDDCDVSLPELDALAAALCDCDGVFGARLTGAGFGGCVIALVDAARAEAVGAAVAERCARVDGQGVRRPLDSFVTEPMPGASVVHI